MDGQTDRKEEDCTSWEKLWLYGRTDRGQIEQAKYRTTVQTVRTVRQTGGRTVRDRLYQQREDQHHSGCMDSQTDSQTDRQSGTDCTSREKARTTVAVWTVLFILP